MIYKSNLLKAIILLSSFGLTQAMEIKKDALFVPHRLGNISVTHDTNGFSIKKDDQSFPVKPQHMDKELRGVAQKKLARLITAGAYLSVNNVGENEYSLNLNGRLKGGGVFGAWLGSTLGYGAVTFAGHGAIHLIALCTGPAYMPVAATLTKMLTIPIHAAACTAAIGTGVTLAVATGPV